MSDPVTSNRDTLADVIERQGALLSTGSDQQDRFRAVEITDALMPTVEAMLAQARAEVTAAVEAELDYAEDHGARDEVDSAWIETAVVRAALAAVSGTDHDTTLDTVRADALRDAADAIDALHPDEAPKNSAIFLRARAARIAPDDTPSERGGDDAA